MKRKGKVKFFVVLALLLAFCYTAFFGVSIDNYYGDTNTFHFALKGAKDIRWGIDISGGVEAVFSPDIEDAEITDENMDSAKEIIETRLVNKNITDYEVFVDYEKHQVVVRFPQPSDSAEKFDAQQVVNDLGETAQLTFCRNTDTESIILTGDDVEKAEGGYIDGTGYVVNLTLKSSGVSKFSKATKELAAESGTISIWMDDIQVSNPKVNEQIDSKTCYIEGMESAEAAQELADKINAGALPFALTTDNDMLQIITPTLGNEALTVMLYAGVIAFAIICLIMITRYRLNGVVASIALLGQAAALIACISGFFDGWDSFTLTVPGIAGIILSIGMGVDTNVITSERIREEFLNGKTIDGAIQKGYQNALSSIIDGNVTNVLVAIVLMGAFGTTESFFYKIFSWVLSFFTTSITGSIYSFGYTLLIGAIVNLIMAVFVSKALLVGTSKFKVLRNPWLYGGAKNEKV